MISSGKCDQPSPVLFRLPPCMRLRMISTTMGRELGAPDADAAVHAFHRGRRESTSVSSRPSSAAKNALNIYSTKRFLKEFLRRAWAASQFASRSQNRSPWQRPPKPRAPRRTSAQQRVRRRFSPSSPGTKAASRWRRQAARGRVWHVTRPSRADTLDAKGPGAHGGTAPPKDGRAGARANASDLGDRRRRRARGLANP